MDKTAKDRARESTAEILAKIADILGYRVKVELRDKDEQPEDMGRLIDDAWFEDWNIQCAKAKGSSPYIRNGDDNYIASVQDEKLAKLIVKAPKAFKAIIDYLNRVEPRGIITLPPMYARFWKLVNNAGLGGDIKRKG